MVPLFLWNVCELNSRTLDRGWSNLVLALKDS